MRGAKEVLVITGRGNQSVGGVAVIRGAIEKLLFLLRRRGVVHGHHEHNPGAFVVELAPLRSLSEAPARRRDRAEAVPATQMIQGLDRETVALLRDLAERSLDALGVAASDRRIADEMQRYLSKIAPALPAGARMEDHLRSALRAAIAEYD